MSETNGWAEYKKNVLFQLQELNDIVKELSKKIDTNSKESAGGLQDACKEIHSRIEKVRDDVIILKTKAMLLGAVAGFIVALLSLLVHILK
jgi:hypothetical protein